MAAKVRNRGPKPNWQPRETRQKGILADLIARFEQHYDEDTLPRGPRGIFYDLRPNGLGHGITYLKPTTDHPVKAFDKATEAHPAAVGEVLGLARRAGTIKEEWVADGRTPEPIIPPAFASAEDFADNVVTWAEDFKLEAQHFQPVFIEVLCEAADLQPRLARIAGDYGVPVYSGSGFDGIKPKKAFAERARRRDVPTVVLHIGDHDKSGEDVYYAVAEDAVAWLESWGHSGYVYPIGASLAELEADFKHAGSPAPHLNFYRLALTREQAKELELLDKMGKAEVDGVPVKTMDKWLTDAIESLQDQACRAELLTEQESERERLGEIVREKLNEVNGL